MNANEPAICIVLLIGIPASGKSYFTSCLVKWFTKCNNISTSLKNVYVIPVTYDKYTDHQHLYPEDNNWKNKRTNIFNSVENVINILKENNSENECLLSDVFNISIATQANYIMFVIDDNMYYRSMRYQYYQLARKYNLGFCQFYLKTSLNDALFHNLQGNRNIVPENDIIKMFNILEPPNINSNKWEELSLVIDSFTNFNDVEFINYVIGVIEKGFKNPIISCNTETSKQESQDVTNSNVLHQLDIILRRIIGKQIKEASESIKSKDNLLKVSQSYCDKKKMLLERIKKGDLLLPFPTTVFQTNETDDIELVRKFLLEHL